PPCALHNLTELVVTSGLKPKMAILGNFLTINLSLSSFQRTIMCLVRDIMDEYFASAKILGGA
ncbi:hypothetical protein WI697_27190, partial [Tistrella mobilis]|uniref:hypothetical protein n=1 Tax=Tistrella mobilis TaxID=171437 RepID=UPI0031F626E0